MGLILGRSPDPFLNRGIQFVTSATNDHDTGIMTTMPAGFGDGEFTFEIVIEADESASTGDISGTNPGAARRDNWATNTAEPYDDSEWWFWGNFLLDGHNNNNFSNGTFSLQIYNSGYVRWTFGDGSAAAARSGGLHGIQNSSGTNILDGNRHVIACVRAWDGGTGSILSLYVDGVLQDSETSTARTDMAATYWDSWTGYPSGQDGWYFAAEKQSVVTADFDFGDYKGNVRSVAFFNGAKTVGELQGINDAVDTGHADYADHYLFDEGTGNPVSESGAITMTLTNAQSGGFWV